MKLINQYCAANADALQLTQHSIYIRQNHFPVALFLRAGLQSRRNGKQRWGRVLTCYTDYCRRINCLSFIYFVFHLVCRMFASLVTGWKCVLWFSVYFGQRTSFCSRWVTAGKRLVIVVGTPLHSAMCSIADACLPANSQERLPDGVCNCSIPWLWRIGTSNTLLRGQCCGKIIAKGLRIQLF